ncbi:hypothetical protein A6R68_08947, partial [Neotoma lepida]
CLLCLQEPGDPEKLGDFLQKNNLCVHYFCLVSKCPLRAAGSVSGSLELNTKVILICFVCKKKGAAIKCQNYQCVKNFHLPCGQERGCLSQFFGEYKSFCEKHRPTQDIQQGSPGEESCVLCCEDLSRISVENIRSPCCSQAMYHRKCIQKYAHTSAKHFFKCPQCNNREEFPKEMLRMGIHIPDRDAAWELEPGAFSELYQRYQHCDAPICLYEQGRDSFEDEGINNYIPQDLGDIPCCSNTFHSQEHFFRPTNLEENPGSSWTEWLRPSLLEKPESSGGRRSRSWRSKGVRISKGSQKPK